jgi:hypothetical protein
LDGWIMEGRIYIYQSHIGGILDEI